MIAISLFALLLAIWGNALSILFGSTATLPGGTWPFVATGIALMVVSLAAARPLRLGFADLFFRRGRVLPGIAIGASLGVALALVSVAALRFIAPPIVGRSVDYAPLAELVAPDLIRHVVFFLPFGAVLPEELAFRGVLLAALARALGTRPAILISAATFALWHASVAFVTVAATTIGPSSPWSLPAVAGALVVVFTGGAVLAWLRVATGNLLSTIAAHWAFNLVVLAGLWSTRPPTQAGCC